MATEGAALLRASSPLSKAAHGDTPGYVYATFDQAVEGERHPQTRAWCLSRALLAWVTPLMRLSHRKHLDASDVWPLQTTLQSQLVANKFRRDYDATRSLSYAFIRSFGARFALTGLAFLVSMLCTLVGPVVLRHVVSSLEDLASFSLESTMLWVGALFAAQVLQALVDCYANFGSETIAIELVAALKTLLYTKTLRLSAASRASKSTGDIANMYTSDSDAIMAVAYLVHQLWLIPVQIAIVSYMLYDVLDVAAFACIGMIILILCVNHLLANAMFRHQRIYRKSKDLRMKKITELFKAISIVKLNAWEDPFREQIRVARAVEMNDLWRRRILVAWSIALLWGMPVFINIVTFGVFTTVVKRELTPAIVFTSIALFQLIQGPLRQITQVVPMLVQSKVGVQHVAAFLEMPELDSSAVSTTQDGIAATYSRDDVVLAIEDGEFAWDDTASSVLRGVNLQIKRGDFYVVHGAVGCGKSSLCAVLLGEMVKRKGSVYMGGSVAYCSQQPWIQNMTVRENILFGLPYDHIKYERVLDACALVADLASLPAGDRTEIGERGVNVSGGQKARIALARACYSDASIFILDAPLSAVDAIVQNAIFQKCLLGLLRHKTVVLVTHNPEIIASAYITHAITIDENGRLVETHRVQERAMLSETSVVPSMALTAVKHEEARHDHSGKLINEEQRFEGRVSHHVFSAYYRAVGGLAVVLAFVVSQLVWQSLQIASDFWLSAWAGDKPTEPPTTAYRLSVYAALGLASAAMVLVRMLMVTVYGLRAARNLFDWMTDSLLHAPLRFFDTNPIGRILTRYAGDVSLVDMNLPQKFGRLAQSLFTVVFSTVVAALVIQWRGLLLVPVAVVYCWVGLFYIRPARELERLVKTSQAPVLNHLSESVDGSGVVRAFGLHHVERFQKTHATRLDANSKVWYAQLCVSQWFSLRIQLLGSVLVLVVTTSLLLLRHALDAAIIGLAFSYSLKVSQNLEELVKIVAEIESAMVSPERIQEYIDIDHEPPHRVPSQDPAPIVAWPPSGSIEFVNVSFRYKRGDPLVLQELSFQIAGGEKVGIVGRTGAGKSSLTMALFRINELASGSIEIDGVDISRIGLTTLREKLSIIPQNPVLFKGSLRSNLDLFNKFSDDELWHSLRQVGLRDRLASDDRKLDCIVDENGENFSVGERQLLCMARALLRHARIVVLDEATAAIDHASDRALQQVIRTAFAHSTVLTIAHRLDTILDADRVFVLDSGRLVEASSPADLVAHGSGHFFELVKEGGYLDEFAQSVAAP
jgi:ABC-type multidrug transport system fused ATPase/permease subunit